MQCFPGLKHGAVRGKNVYFNPYSHIDQSLVEVRLTRDNNSPDLGSRHVSVLLSFFIIDPAGLLSAAWIHSQASSSRHTAVTRHKESSISTALELSVPPPACAYTKSLHQPTGSAREKDTSIRKQQRQRKIQ